MKKVAVGRYSLQGKLWSSISKEAKSLMIRMMTHNFKNRPFASELIHDDWFKIAPKTKIDDEVMTEAFKNLSSFRASQKL